MSQEIDNQQSDVKENVQNDKDKLYQKGLDDLQKKFEIRQSFWNTLIDKFSKRLTDDLTTTTNLSAEVISHRQLLVEEKTSVFFMMYRDLPKLKQIKKHYFEYYSTKYPIKINGTEKNKLIDADVAYHDSKMEYIQNHVNYLTETIKTIDNLIYSIRNKIEMSKIIGFD